ncbi:hypothetical protein Kpol_1056p34 [Vanderwaltozyma polyspora DSM 70294]|uniref:HECT-type E3 ubiquitin transferase n=1 Tax=Vanderwaltozyma polyspora (strain ATCC 22028 / DSM 70294 / BCRC 21397 / CBS 2163 / NBRC 10782 / NRRL Y-8283 / UCD 57-17) TaxID=436907 RepID=A7TLP1_VANPO|nr:uncharacterized protein Kpol_1056p34 [Vanderwaltozyma polyspora DSM 70294]EDO16833.1 hypothetical protein Kpol_1056p34 [Vanderwaltozyma polyspora DSM 70294]
MNYYGESDSSRGEYDIEDDRLESVSDYDEWADRNEDSSDYGYDNMNGEDNDDEEGGFDANHSEGEDEEEDDNDDIEHRNLDCVEDDEDDYNHGSADDIEIGGHMESRAATLQELLGHLAHDLEARANNNDSNSSSDDVNRDHRIPFGTGFPDFLSMLGARRVEGSNGRFDRMRKLVANIRNAAEDPYIALESLRELSESLLMMNSVAIDRVIPVESLIKDICVIFSSPILIEELELQLMACRCIYNLFEVSPDCIGIAVEENIIPVLQGKLLEISYIDLAEQVLETLEYISRVQSRKVLEAGNLTSYIQFLDFFTIHAQRKAITIVSNACAKVKLSDFETIREVFPLLQSIFINSTDQNLITKLVNAVYGICGGLRKHINFDDLFTEEFIDHIFSLVSSPELPIDNKLKSIEILTVLVQSSQTISEHMIEGDKVNSMIYSCFNPYKKSQDALLGDILMFVPDNLLMAISRFLAFLFPPEMNNCFTIQNPNREKSIINQSNLNDFNVQIINMMVDIFTSSIDSGVRLYILIAILRIVSNMNSEAAKACKSKIVTLFELSYFKVDNLYNGNKTKMINANILQILLGILLTINEKFKDELFSTLRREGVFEGVELLHSHLDDMMSDDIENDTYDTESEKVQVESFLTDESKTKKDKGSDSEYEYDEMNIPEYVKPKKISFELLKRKSHNQILHSINNLCEDAFLLLDSNKEVIQESSESLQLVLLKLQKADVSNLQEEYWNDLWDDLKQDFLGENGISVHDFISSDLPKLLVDILRMGLNLNPVIKTSFFISFEPVMDKFINFLHMALSKAEKFTILECGLQGDEGGVASLGKEMNIKLVYKGDAKKDGIVPNLSTVTLSIHSIASLSTLNDFLKHKVTQSMFLDSLLSGLSNNSRNEDGSLNNLRNITFQFYDNETPLGLDTTIFSVVYKKWVANGTSITERWNETPTIYYKKLNKISPIDDEPMEQTLDSSYTIPDASKEILDSHAAEMVLRLLKFLHDSDIPQEKFINMKLSAKLSRQLDEPLIVASRVLPEWVIYLTSQYPFIFPLDTRIFFLQCTSFGYGRLIELWLNRSGKKIEQSSDDPLQQLGTVLKRKLRITRSDLFASGLKILENYGSNPNIIEIEYQDEAGTGLGPTLEFYATMSRDFAKKSLDIWSFGETEDENEIYIQRSLFPRPLETCTDQTKTLELFTYLGEFVAKAILDGRILDFRFNRLMFELIEESYNETSIRNSDVLTQLKRLSVVDYQLAKSLQYIFDQKNNNKAISDLELTFVLPGYGLELIEHGKNVPITSANVEEYISRVLSMMIEDGVKKQLNCFKEGFSRVFPYRNMLILTPNELVTMFGEAEEDWSAETLYSCITAEHGYTMDSQTIHDLVHIISNFDNQDRRLFLQFITGSPKLPIGGFKSLKPKLTVVLKHAEDGSSPDEYLPSVMTCANYLKLPKYSDKLIMSSRISQAIKEGSGAFLLS